jgi:hypothetical protein
MRLPFAIGAVVEGVPTTSHTPLSGQFSPVLAVIPTAITMILSVSSEESGDNIPLGFLMAGIPFCLKTQLNRTTPITSPF